MNENNATPKIKKRGFFHLPNLKGWLAYEELKTQAQYIAGIAKPYFVPQKAAQQETFAHAVKRLKLTKNELAIKRQTFLRLAIIYAIIATCILLYSIYLAWHGFLGACASSFVLSLIVYTLAFKQHFWAFQIQQRKLGCSVKEWFNSKATGDK